MFFIVLSIAGLILILKFLIIYVWWKMRQVFISSCWSIVLDEIQCVEVASALAALVAAFSAVVFWSELAFLRIIVVASGTLTLWLIQCSFLRLLRLLYFLLGPKVISVLSIWQIIFAQNAVQLISILFGLQARYKLAATVVFDGPHQRSLHILLLGIGLFSSSLHLVLLYNFLLLKLNFSLIQQFLSTVQMG